MGILDDIKSSVDGSKEVSERGANSLDTSLDDASGTTPDRKQGGAGTGRGTSTGRYNAGAQDSTPAAGRLGGNSGNPDSIDSARDNLSSRGRSTGSRSTSRSSGRQESPNPQAGRPRQGSAKPRVSESTRREMQSAGLTSSDSSSGMEEKLKDIEKQNDQMIQILQRIERNLR
jgi:hypothetical protein